MTNILIVTVGLPYSGKSSFAITTGYPIVSPDAVSLAYGTRFNTRLEPIVWATVHAMVSKI